jgi:hypothetical protein
MATKKDSATHYTIGCRLPTGIILEHPLDPKKTVKLKGLNQITILGAGYATTPVDADFWEHWKMVHKDFSALKTGAIFEAGTVDDAAAVAAELAKEKTGFEKMPQKAQGIKSAKED